MAFEFDPDKDTANREKHGLSLADASEVDIRATQEDERRDYGERRFRAFGFLGEEAVCLVFTTRGENIRPISLRRAHKKEMKRYGL